MEASSIKVDGRSGKPVSLDLKHPILPGDGVGNALLWSVGGGHGSPDTPEEWGDIGVKAVKVRASFSNCTCISHLLYSSRVTSSDTLFLLMSL